MDKSMIDLRPEVPIWRTVAAGYRAGIGVLVRDGALFRYFIYASALSLSIIGLQYFALGVSPSAMPEDTTPAAQALRLALGFLTYVAYAMAISPLTAAVYRKVLLGEAPRDLYVAAMFQAPQLRLVVATIAVFALFFVAELMSYPVIYLVYGLNPLDTPGIARAYAAQPAIALILTLLTWAAHIVAALASTRLAFAFPAIATRAPGASLRQSYADTRGSTWRLFFIFLLIFFFPFLVFIAVTTIASIVFVIDHPEAMRTPDAVGEMMMLSPPFLVIYAVMFLVMMTMVAVIAAAAARAYEIRVNRGMSGVAEVFA